MTSTDRNGTVHTLSYDVLGRLTSDAVTTLGSGVDGAVRRIETAYDGQGNAFLITSCDAASGGNVVNQVMREFNGLGQLITEWQEHAGEVDTETTIDSYTTPNVQYAYSDMPSGANHSRLTSMTYPSGWTLSFDYGTASALNGRISRLESLKESSTVLEGYEYLGLGTVVVRSHPVPDVDLTYVKRSGESNGDAGDPYIGLDRFGRVVDHRWLDPSTGTATDRFQYTYDRNGNRTARTNLLNSAFNETYGYDGLNQLTGFDRGTYSQDWDYDALGNWSGFDVDGTLQTRTYNAQNEITGISSTTTPAFDANGNMTGDETGRQFVYDAWNRLVAVKNSGGVTLKTYGYDGLSRRVTEDDGTDVTDLYYSDSWQVLEEKVNGDTTTHYVWSIVYVDAMILRDRDTDGDGTLNERLWVQQDANFNVAALVGGLGGVIERYAFSPFGVVTVLDVNWGLDLDGESDVEWVYLHQGLRYDNLATLYDNFNRWYDAGLGRFSSLDPIRFRAGDPNFYRYVSNNPSTVTDPSGLFWNFVVGGAAGGCLQICDNLMNGEPWYAGTGKATLIGAVGGGLFKPVSLVQKFGVKGSLQIYGGAAISVGTGSTVRLGKPIDTRLFTVYRGVNEKHPAYPDALRGDVFPRRKWYQFFRNRPTPLEHNTAPGATEYSPYTSWSTDKDVAINFALRPSAKKGVLVEAKVPAYRLVESPDLKMSGLIHKSGTIVSENEVLVIKCVKGVPTVVRLNDFKKDQ